MVCILTSTRGVSANCLKSEQTYRNMEWVCSHMPIHNHCRCSNTLYVFCIVLQPQPWHSYMVCTLTSPRASANSPKSEQTSVVITVWVCSHMPIHNRCRCLNTLYMYDMDVGCSLKGSTASTIAQLHRLHTYITEGFSQLSQIWTKVYICGDNDVSVQPHAHPQPLQVLKHLIYVWYGCGIHLEWFYSFNCSIVTWFAHFHSLGFQPTLPNLEKRLWW